MRYYQILFDIYKRTPCTFAVIPNFRNQSVLYISCLITLQDVTLVGHNWGWMVGAGVARVRPQLFSRLVILNTNNLPDGEAELDRYTDMSTLASFLVLNSFFLFFRSSMNLLREHFPLSMTLWRI